MKKLLCLLLSFLLLCSLCACGGNTTEPVETEEPTYPCDELLLEETEVLMTEYEQKLVERKGLENQLHKLLKN